MQKQIHIHAKCKAFEVFVQVPENKAVKKLESIERSFTFSRNHYVQFDDYLIVKTQVVNPELPFKYS